VIADATGKVLRRLEGHENGVFGLAASPTGDRLIAADHGGRGRLWHLATGATQCTIDATAGYMAAAWAPTGDRVAVAGDDGLVRVGEVSACTGGKELGVRALGTSRGRVRAVAAEERAFLGDATGRVSAWDRTTWQLAESTRAHAGEVKSIAPLRDGRWVSAGSDRWVVLGGRGGMPRKLAALRSDVSTLAALPSGEGVLAGDMAGSLIEIPFGEDMVPTVRWTAPRAAPSMVYTLAMEPGGAAALVGGTWNTVVRVPLTFLAFFDTRAEWPRGTPQESTTALAFLPDGRFAQGSTGGDVLLRRNETVEKRLTGLTKEVSALVVTSPHLWAGGGDRVLVRWTIDGVLDPDKRIDEGAKILALAATSNGLLIAGLGDGRASVRSFDDGALVAHLYPFRDGGGATVFANGRFVATQGDAYALRFENPDTREIVTLGDLLRPRMTTPLVTTLPDGSVAVRTTIFSPGGPPTVVLDGSWTIEAITPSRTTLLAYDVDLQLVEPRGGKHTLLAQQPGGEAVRTPFEILPDPRFSQGKTRALVIGNSAYEHRARLPGAATDAALVRAFLESTDGWHLSADRIDARLDLKAGSADTTTLLGAVTDFFGHAEADETLFFYFSGHGDSDATTGYLLPVDAPANTLGDALSANDLWKAIRASKAGRIVVIIDACRAGKFVVPGDLALQSKAVVLAATEPAGSAPDFSSGSAFTRALIGAMSRVDAVDADEHAVTVRTAFRSANNVSEAFQQTPMMSGMGDILRLPLAWPPARKLDRRAAADAGGSKETGFREATAKLATATYANEKGSGAEIRERNGKLEIHVIFDRPTEAVKISAYQPEENYRTNPRAAPAPQRIEPAPGGVWPEGKEHSFPLFDVKTDQSGFIELRICSADGKTCKPPRLLALPSPR
jgi:WD40 repeat protein